MPFADPQTKRAWQKEYNRRYYRANKKSKKLVERAVESRRELRRSKRDWILIRRYHNCSSCGNPGMALELSDPASISNERLLNRAVVDYSWADLQSREKYIILTCIDCRKYG